MNNHGTSAPATGSRDTKRATQEPRESEAARSSRGLALLKLRKWAAREILEVRRKGRLAAKGEIALQTSFCVGKEDGLVKLLEKLDRMESEGTGRVNKD